MAKKSKSKSNGETTPDVEVEQSTQPALEPELMEAVKKQVANQNTSALTNVFASSLFGKKASYAPAVVEEPEPKEKAEKKETGGKKKKKEAGEKKEKKDKKDKKEKKDKKDKKGKKKETKAEEKDPEPEKPKENMTDAEKKKLLKEKKKAKKLRKLQKKHEAEAEGSDPAEKEAEEGAPDAEKNRRTVFIGNVSLDTTDKDLRRHFSVCGAVENTRLRFLPIAGCAVGQAGNQKLMMKVCANKKILSTGKDNCNAYVTFVEESSVEAALKLTGTTLLHRKIRVDHSDPVVDSRRSVFVGNVPFTCTDEMMQLFFTKRLKTEEESEPVENVRLIRDRESGLGKGFGYILLKTPALVAKTLTLSNLKMGNRELRVQVCGKRFKNRRGDETEKEKYEGVRASAGAHARILMKRKTGADAETHVTTKKMKRTAAAAGLGKKLKPKHAARKAAQAAAATEGKAYVKKRKQDHGDKKVAKVTAAAKGKPSKKRKHDDGDKKAVKPKAKKPKTVVRKTRKVSDAKK
ncbi:hypothetical protein BBJ29_004078 [Phytophthora kernoviae]|uniref:RRM domain-containing protein n=1 Tax=Phytophthora kernoviae TaxID=325452 RepID=A0A421G1Z3_9STRA|nr:hypothetical protein BBJ29_004078 [Phytophthora kernoviae]